MKRRSKWRMVSGHEKLPQYLMLAREQGTDKPSPKEAGWGFTTGTALCAAALSSYYAFDEKIMVSTCDKCVVEIESFEYEPQDLPVLDSLDTLSLELGLEQGPWCCVYKNAGEDPDCTDGLLIAARTSVLSGKDLDRKLERFTQYVTEFKISSCSIPASSEHPTIICLALRGVGVVSCAGLKQEQGSAAINPGPQKMLAQAFCYTTLSQKKMQAQEEDCAVIIYVDIPNGEELARKTFNGRLGIVGGISVLGTTGFVRPMSQEALIEALLVELEQRAACSSLVLMAFGAAGEKQARKLLGIAPEASIQVSNYIGILFDHALKRQVKHIVIAGAPGKLIKLAAGIVYTHSLAADGRREILACEAALMGAPQSLVQELYEAPTCDAAYILSREAGLDALWQRLNDKVLERMLIRATRILDEQEYTQFKLEVLMLHQDGSQLAYSAKSVDLSDKIKE